MLKSNKDIILYSYLHLIKCLVCIGVVSCSFIASANEICNEKTIDNNPREILACYMAEDERDYQAIELRNKEYDPSQHITIESYSLRKMPLLLIDGSNFLIILKKIITGHCSYQ